MQTSSKTIWVQPSELVFNQVSPSQTYLQSFTLQNTLSAPVDLVLKSSSAERMECNPKQLKLAPREICQVECTFKQLRPFPAKCTKQTETIFIKSDFFDQKINVTILPAQIPQSPSLSLQQTGVAFGQKQFSSKVSRRADESRDLMELAGESFGKGSQRGVLSPQQFLRPDLTVGSQEDDMRALNSDFERESAQALPGNSTQRDELSQLVGDLRAENQQLKQLLMEAQNELQNQKQVSGEQQLQNIREMLRAREPKLEELLIEAMKHERINQEKKDKKVLEILQFKDQQIDDLTMRLQQAEDAAAQAKQRQQQQMRETQALMDQLTEKVSLFENEEKFRELMQAQDKVITQGQRLTALEKELAAAKAKLGEADNKELYFADVIRQCKAQLEEKERVLLQLVEAKQREEQRVEALQFQVDEFKVQIGKVSAGARDHELTRQAKAAHEAAAELQRQLNQSKEVMAQVYQILGRVTGEEASLTGAESHSSLSKLSGVTLGIDQRLEQRAEEIVKVVEQVQAQYTQLEQEMRALVDLKSEKSSTTTKPALKASKQFESKASDRVIKTMESKLQSDDDYWTRGSQEQVQEGLNPNSSSKHLTQVIEELKDRERQLLEQLTYMKEQLRFQTSNSADTIDQAQFTQDHQLQRIAELETLIFQQREQILTQQDEITNLRQGREDSNCEMKNQIELLSLRNRNLQELNKRAEASDMFASGTFHITSPTMKSTAVETERVRQQAQQLELANMDLQHKLQEAKLAGVQATKQVETMKGKVKMLDREMAFLQQELVMKKAGLSSSDSKMANLVQELRNRIKVLETQRSETGTNYLTSGRQAQSTVESAASFQTTHNLQGQTFFALKEEYCSKLEKLVDQNASERSQLQNQVLGYAQKNENLLEKIRVMEDKEMKWFTQVEELKLQLQSEQDIHVARIKDLERVLQQKSSHAFDLEREVKQKEKMLSERQEQLSILLSAMEQQQDDPQQKIANLAAELCSMKAVEAQSERKAAELIHQERQTAMHAAKLQSELADNQQQISKLKRSIQTLESSKELLERKGYDLGNQLDEVRRELSESSYKLERLQFQTKVKEETIEQLKSQLKSSEVYFTEQIRRLKDECTLTASKPYSQETRPRRETGLKHDIQRLHLVISDYIERSNEHGNSIAKGPQQLIAELEKSLKTATETVSKLEGDLDRERHKVATLENEWDAQALNTILVSRQERLTACVRVLTKLIEEREIQHQKVTKSSSESYTRILRELEQKVESQTKQLQQADDAAVQLNQQLNRLVLERDDLSNSVLCFQQELANQKTALELKAQLSVDERFKAKNDAISQYFENQISNILMAHPSGDGQKLAAIAKETVALQILIDKQRKQIEQLTSQFQAVDFNLRFYRERLADEEQKSRQGSHSLQQQQADHNTATVALKIELERKKQAVLALEKDLILAREGVEHKASENVQLIQRIENIKAGEMYDREMNYIRQRVDGTLTSSADFERQSKKIQQLQEQLMDLRGTHIQELDDLRLQSDMELAEAKREVSRQKFELERRFSPGATPGELMERNEELQQMNHQLHDDIENLIKERDQMQRQIDELVNQVEYSREDTHGYRQALQDLESALLSGHTSQAPPLTMSKGKKSQKTLEQPLEVSQLQSPDKFVRNPPLLIRELLKAKAAELAARTKLREHLVIESKLRQQVTTRFQQEAAISMSQDLVDQLVSQNENLLALLNTNPAEAPIQSLTNEPAQQLCPEDSTLLVNAIISLVEQVASTTKELPTSKQMLEKVPLSHVVEAQRIVIRALSARHNSQKISYAPEREIDRKIWYLELLEQQVAEADKSAQSLQDFVKRLQIGVSGNLHSAAEIKATSMDLAQNLKQASDEIKSLRHIAGLMKHDVLQQQHADADKQSLANPFLEGENTHRSNRLQETQRSNFDRLMHENESMHNQLSLTSKIKQSIEQELVNAKLQHATELQNLISKFSSAEKQLSMTLQENASLKERVTSLQQQLESKDSALKAVEAELAKKEEQLSRQKGDAAKSKDTTKHLHKLQADMQEWRKQSEANLKIKAEQLKAAQDQVSTLNFEKEKLKVEVLMLRKAQKAIRDGHELTRVEEQNKLLAQKLELQCDERKQEIDFWVAERAQMRERIEQLENAQHATTELPGQAHELKELKTKLKGALKQLRTKELEQQALQNELLSAKDSLAKVSLDMLTAEQRVREEALRQTDAHEQLQLALQRVKEVEIEKDLLVAETRRQMRKNDTESTQVGFEVDSLRSEFAKLKFEKENLVGQIEAQKRRELEFNSTVERLTAQVQSLSNNSLVKINEQENVAKTLEQKNTALLADLKYMRIENEKLQARLRETQQQVMAGDAQHGQVTQEMQAQVSLMEEVKRKILDAETALRTKSMRISELEAELLSAESNTYAKIKSLQEGLSKVKAEAMQTQAVFASQISALKQRATDKGKAGGKEVELSLQLAQKETVTKQLKKEVTTLKSQTQKLKQKNATLKEQLEAINQKPTQPVETRGKKAPVVVEKIQSPFEGALIEKLLAIGGLQNLLKELRHLNQLEAHLTESEQNVVKLESWNSMLSQQIEELHGQQEDREEMISEMRTQQKEIRKEIQGTAAANEKMLREQLKHTQRELEQTKNEWLSPQACKEQVELVASLQQQLKQLQGEVARKGKLVSQLKTQKEAQEEETTAFITSMNELKDDYQRQQKIIKEFHKRDNQTKDLRSQIEWLQKQERTAKEEVLSLNDKLKQAKSELVRKDQIIKEYRDRIEGVNEGQKATKDLSAELDKQKDIQRKHKLELEIKDNQIRVLKQRLECIQEEMQGLSQAKEGMRTHETQLDGKLKALKIKAKRYEAVLRCAIDAIRAIAQQLAMCATKDSQSQRKTGRKDEPLKADDLHKDAAYYKESVEILGLGLNELETFINPSKGIQPYNHSFQNKSGSRLSGNATPSSREEIRGVLHERLDRLEYLLGQKCSNPTEMQRDIEELAEACSKIILELQN